MTRANGVTTNYAYDNLSRLLSVLHQVGLTTIDGASYTYDNAGNRTSKVNQLNAVTENYTYDPIYQLTQVVQGLNTTEAYTYDVVGNRLSTVSDSGWTYDSSNHLTSRPGVTYTYDNNGNTATKVDSNGTTTYAWDYLNRLTSVTLPGSGGTVTFKYDPFGRRIQKVGPSGTTNYLYDGANVIEEVDGTGTVLARYAQGAGIDQPLDVFTSGATKYYDADGLGSVTSLADITGSLTDTYVTDSFGKTTTSTGNSRNPYRYTARDLDSETGLYYYRARYYDPSAGRFISEDPVRFSAGANFYRYVRNNPVLFSNPSGTAEKGPKQVCFCYRFNQNVNSVPWPLPKGCYYSCECVPGGTEDPEDWVLLYYNRDDIRKACGVGRQCLTSLVVEKTEEVVPRKLRRYKIISYTW